MAKHSEGEEMGIPKSVDITDEDVYDAMKEIPGYLDITPGDFKEVYRQAYRRAVERLRRSVKAKDVMTREVIFVDINTPMKEVAQTLGSHGISGLPVVDLEGMVVGRFLSWNSAGRSDKLQSPGGNGSTHDHRILWCFSGARLRRHQEPLGPAEEPDRRTRVFRAHRRHKLPDL